MILNIELCFNTVSLQESTIQILGYWLSFLLCFCVSWIQIPHW